MNKLLKTIPILFLLTFLFYYPISFYIGILSIILTIYKCIKKEKINCSLKVTVILFSLECINILTLIKVLILEYTVFSCSMLVSYSPNILDKLDYFIQERMLSTNQIIICNAKNGKKVLLDNVINFQNKYVDENQYTKYFIKDTLGIEAEFIKKSFDQLIKWSTVDTIVLNNFYNDKKELVLNENNKEILKKIVTEIK